MLIRLHRLICNGRKKNEETCQLCVPGSDGQAGAFLNTFKGSFKYNDAQEKPAEEKKNRENRKRWG